MTRSPGERSPGERLGSQEHNERQQTAQSPPQGQDQQPMAQGPPSQALESTVTRLATLNHIASPIEEPQAWLEEEQEHIEDVLKHMLDGCSNDILRQCINKVKDNLPQVHPVSSGSLFHCWEHSIFFESVSSFISLLESYMAPQIWQSVPGIIIKCSKSIIVSLSVRNLELLHESYTGDSMSVRNGAYTRFEAAAHWEGIGEKLHRWASPGGEVCLFLFP